MPSIRGNVQTLLTSGAVTTSGTSSTFNLSSLMGGEPDGGQFLLKVSTVSTAGGLDAYLQWSPDAGSSWIDFVHWPQVTNSTGTTAMCWSRRDNDGVGGTPNAATGDAVLAAGKAINAPIASNYCRVKYIISTSGGYNFSVTSVLDRD